MTDDFTRKIPPDSSKKRKVTAMKTRLISTKENESDNKKVTNSKEIKTSKFTYGSVVGALASFLAFGTLGFGMGKSYMKNEIPEALTQAESSLHRSESLNVELQAENKGLKEDISVLQTNLDQALNDLATKNDLITNNVVDMKPNDENIAIPVSTLIPEGNTKIFFDSLNISVVKRDSYTNKVTISASVKDHDVKTVDSLAVGEKFNYETLDERYEILITIIDYTGVTVNVYKSPI